MKTPKIESNKSTSNSALADDDNVENSEKKVTGRRLQDTLSRDHPKRKMNLDRRAENSDRRIADDPNYSGPARRNTIDRRLNLKDRRKKD
ncbi:MAG: hypothetical protein KJN89_05780 [Gammaproteobacteria bacterium]|nr:hypothetical protein [Gammaproteobacteria bacterium]NNJ49865.1 hypothetical protein [Gammaproteobacteria bacterium]